MASRTDSLLPMAGATRRGSLRRLVPVLALTAVVACALLLVRMQIQLPAAAIPYPAGPAWWPMLAGISLVSVSIGALLALTWASRHLFSRGSNGAAAVVARTAVRGLAGDRPPAAVDGGLDAASAWRLLLELGNHGYWVTDPQGRYLRVDPAADQAGSRIRELVGTTTLPIPVGATTTERPRAIPTRRRRILLGDGTRLTIEETGRPMFDVRGRFLGYHGVVRDLSHLGEREPLAVVLGALAGAPLPALLVRRQFADEATPAQAWTPVWANRALTALSEFAPAELQERSLVQWLLVATGQESPSAAMPEAANPAPGTGPHLIRLLESRQESCGRGMLIDRFGRRHEVTIVIEPLPTDGMRQLALVMIDAQGPALAHLQARAEHVDDLERTIARRARDTEWANQELEAFTHTVSHDLRQPIRQITGFARILQEDHSELLDPTGRDHINRILNASHRMAGMIEALLEMHRISAHAIARDPIDLSTMAAELAEDLRQANPSVAADFAIEPHVACQGDRQLMRMVLSNLFENAWKYSARSERRKIRFGTRVQDGRRVFEVADNGIGFDMRFADQIFSLFHRLHGRGEFLGNGVGLATVQRIIRRHKGRIWAESQPGTGSVFRFTLWENDD
ncbi:MAG: ATP-binding protein [Burkholderiaceae bacterium]